MSKVLYNYALKDLSRKLRNNATKAERLLWKEIKGRKLKGYQFSRQKPISNYIADFYSFKLKLVIELDGASHIGREEYDKKRQNDIELIGFTVLRFDNSEIENNIEAVINTINKYIDNFEITNRQPPYPL
ncbi:MAG: DUF559 domain-containing protein [Ignavibacteria bacterium]|nr:DUF559 domain-containing protein [Ignavibacteria bacterium]